jgi:hypothetical protein
MDEAARGSAGGVVDEVADISGVEIQPLGGKPIVPFVEPIR